MQFGFSEDCLAHDPGPRHPETPDRLRAIRERLKRKHGVRYVEPDPRSLSDLTAVHDREYLESVREFCAGGGGDWDPDTSAVAETWPAIRASAGGACWAVEAALEGASGRQTPFSLGRPPGHHAVADDAMGFCFVNNVAVGAQHALAVDVADGADCERVAVVDWDVHHGNGTQDIFYDRDDVFVVSLHERGLYPGTGDVDETGEGAGEATTLNVPMPAGAGDADYLAALEDVVAPALEAFDPDCVCVSTGFDAHQHDPISRIRLSTDAYGCMTDWVRGLADRTGAALAFVLEGGYALEALADGVAEIHETFDGRAPIEPDDGVNDDVDDLLAEVADAHDLEY